MDDTEKTKQQLIQELNTLRQQVVELEKAETAHQRTEEVLRESEEKYRILVESTRDWVWAVDTAGHHTFSNQAIKELLGFEVDEIVGTSAFPLIHPDDQETTQTLLKRALEHKLGWQDVAVRWLHKDGSVRHFESTSQPFLDHAGHLIGFVGIDRDITERKRAEVELELHRNHLEALVEEHTRALQQEVRGHKQAAEALRSALNFNTTVLDTVASLVVVADPQGNIVSFNRACEHCTGYTFTEVWNTPVWQLIPQEEVTAVRTVWSELVTTTTPNQFENYWVAKNGEKRLIAWSNAVLTGPDGAVEYIMSTGTDITERKATEAALRENEATIRTLLNAPKDLVLMTDVNGVILAINDPAAQRFDKQADDLLGVCFYDLVSPDFTEFRQKQIEAVVRSGQPIHFEDERDGIWYETAIHPVFDGQGSVTRLAFMSRNITHRKQAEQRRLELAKEKERRQVLSGFVAQASHEFRTQLTIINTAAYVLRKADNHDKQDQQISKIEDQVKSITTLVDALTTMAKLDSIRDLTTDEVDLCEVVSIVSKMQRQSLQAKNIQQVIEMDVQSLWVHADSYYLQRAITDIVDNAIHFTPRGGTITLRADRRDHEAVLEIMDTGAGIGNDDLSHIFEIFWRADKVGTTRGFGLGLPIVKRILDLHQGKIEVESQVGKGSAFRVILPLAR